MGKHFLVAVPWQRMFAALETVPDMHLDRLRRFVASCFVVMRTILTWVELGCLPPSVETAKERSHRRVKKAGARPPDGMLKPLSHSLDCPGTP